MKRFSSLYSRVALLLFAIVLPVLGILFYSVHERRQTAEKALKLELAANARILSGLMSQEVEGVRQLLIALSHEQVIRQRQAAPCSRLLTELKGYFPEYVNFGVTDPKGNIFCSATPMTKPVNSADLAWFRNAVKGRNIGIGDYQIGRITGKQILNTGYAARDGAGRIQAVVYAPFYLDALNELLKKAELKPEAALIMLDRNGTILVRRPDHEKWVGKTIRESDLIKTILTQREGLLEAKGVDGIKRIYSYTPVAGTDNSIFISTGISKEVALAEINRQFARNLLLFGLLAALSFGAAMMIGKLALQSEEKLVKNAEQLQDLYDNAPNGYVSVGNDGSIRRCNRKLSGMLEYETDKLLGMPVLNLYADTPDGKGKAKKVLQRFLSGETIYDEELQMQKADRTLLWISLNVNVVRDPQGRILESRSIIQDITERKQAEKALRESEERLRLSTELANVAVWEYSFITNSMSRSKNHDQLYGLDWQAAWDINTFLSATHPDDRGLSNDIIQKAAAAGGPDHYQFDFRVVYPDQSIHWLMVVGQVVERNAEGQGTIVRGCLIDITVRKKAEEEISKLNFELEQRVKDRTEELEVKIAEIERINKLFVGRELRIIELKEKMKELEKKNTEFRSQE